MKSCTELNDSVNTVCTLPSYLLPWNPMPSPLVAFLPRAPQRAEERVDRGFMSDLSGSRPWLKPI